MTTRLSKQFLITEKFSEKAVLWVGQQEYGCCFQGGGWGKHFDFPVKTFAAAGKHKSYGGPLTKASGFIESQNDYVITHLAYDVKNQLEKLKSNNPSTIEFEEMGIYVPVWTFLIEEKNVEIGWPANEGLDNQVDSIFYEIESIQVPEMADMSFDSRTESMNKPAYLSNIKLTQKHIQLGDIYQANICQEFIWNNVDVSGSKLFIAGFETNPNPFSVYLKNGKTECLCWSPERFVTFFDGKVLSQPMKGTSPRGKNIAEDETFFTQLKNSEKDRRENVMIVDMVRNDLSHFADRGAVKVSELYKIKAYPRVHQMHSTITAHLKPSSNLFDTLLKAFPMGSMTGTPKIRAMEIIEQLESTRRGIYSGTIGFITPEKNADFNVVIRTLVYDSVSKKLSCHVGGGITALSDPLSEYGECLLKLAPINQLIESTVIT
jgi:para-aminobenzoate synthetase component I